MVNKWQFDQEYIKKCIDQGDLLLDDPNLSKSKRMLIKNDLSTFKQFLIGNFEYNVDAIPTYLSDEKLKKSILYKMKKHYRIIGEDLINLVLTLKDAKIFEGQYAWEQTSLSIDLQTEFTLKNYEKHSKFLLEYAKNIFSEKPTSQIQVVKDFELSSYCHYSNIVKLPFLIIDPTDAPSILNHELQHGIEDTLGLKMHDFFIELGPLYFELLFTDLLYEQQGYVLEGDYQDRFDDMSYFIDSLCEYFIVMKEFSKTNFEVTMEKFKNTFLENADVTYEELYSYLYEVINSYDMEDNMCYLFSFLKAIELREQTKRTKDDAFNILIPYIQTKKFDFRFQENNLTIYQSFVKEMKQKAKTK